MTWHKYGRRYNPEKLVHPYDGEAWTRFDMIHCEKALEARNVCVALAIDASLMFIWLTMGGKYSSFDKHRQFLPLDRPFR